MAFTDPLLRQVDDLRDDDPLSAAGLARSAEERSAERRWTEEDYELVAVVYAAAANHLVEPPGNRDVEQRRKAADWLASSAAAFGKAGNPDGEADAVLEAGMLLSSVGDLPAALGSFERALHLAEILDDAELRAWSLSQLGRTRVHLNDSPGAAEAYAGAAEAFDAIGDARHEANTRSAAGTLLAQNGELAAAFESFERAAALCAETWNRGGEADAQQNLGNISLALGERERAAEFLGAAFHGHALADDLGGMAGDLAHLARTARATGRQRRAVLFLESALGIYRRDAQATVLEQLLMLGMQGDYLLETEAGWEAGIASLHLALELARAGGAAQQQQDLEERLEAALNRNSERPAGFEDRLAGDAESLRTDGLTRLLDEGPRAAAFYDDQMVIAETAADWEGFITAVGSQAEIFSEADLLVDAMAALLVAEEAVGQMPREQQAASRRRLDGWLAALESRAGEEDLAQLREQASSAPEERRARAVESLIGHTEP